MDIFLVQLVAVKGHIKHEKYLSPHLDVLFLLEADEREQLRYREDESKGVKWIELNEATDETMCELIRPIHKKLISKLKNK